MPIVLRKIIIISFMVATVLLSSTLLYTLHLYYGIYRATRVIDIKIQKFEVKVFNISYVVIARELLVENPSEYGIQAITIKQTFRLNGRYISTMFVDLTNNTDIRPMSNTTLMSQHPVPSHLTQYVAEEEEKHWLAETNAMLQFPLVGKLALTFYDSPQSHYTNS